MIQDDKSTLTIILGKQTISGTKSASGAYKNPNAKVEIYDKNLSIDVPKGTSKLILKSLFEYEEATTKKDIPNFLFALKDKNGKVFAKKSWSDPDIFYKFEEFSGELTIEIDLQDFYSEDEKVKLNFSAHLECWLEESSWKPNAPQKRTTSAFGDADLEFGLPKVVFPGAEPEINLDILPTHSPGKDLKTVDINTDWGNPYFLKLNLNNKSKNQIVSGGFDLFEDTKKIKSASLEKPLDSKWKTLVVSEDGATWVLIKGPKDWVWYKKSGDEFKIKKENQIYKYFASGKTIDEFGFKFDLETENISVNVRVPDYKKNAMDTYNKVKAVKTAADIFSLIFGIGGGKSLWDFAKDLKTIGFSIKGIATLVLSLEIAIGAWLISGEASEVLDVMKQVMDDPPEINARRHGRAFQRKNLSNFKSRSKIINNSVAIANMLGAISTNLNRSKLANDAYWSARLKSNLSRAKTYSQKLAVCDRDVDFNTKQAAKQILILSKKINKLKPHRLSNSDLKKIKNLGFTEKQILVIKKISSYVYKNKRKLTNVFSSLAISLKQFGKSYGRRR